MKLGIAEILDKADKAKTKEEKLELLQRNVSNTLLDVLRLAFGGYQWALKQKKYLFKPSPFFDQEMVLFNSLRKIPSLFLEGSNPNLADEKRDVLWVQFLEGLDKNDAVLMEAIRQGKMPFKTITKDLVEEAFPGYLDV